MSSGANCPEREFELKSPGSIPDWVWIFWCWHRITINGFGKPIKMPANIKSLLKRQRRSLGIEIEFTLFALAKNWLEKKKKLVSEPALKWFDNKMLPEFLGLEMELNERRDVEAEFLIIFVSIQEYLYPTKVENWVNLDEEIEDRLCEVLLTQPQEIRLNNATYVLWVSGRGNSMDLKLLRRRWEFFFTSLY